MWKRVLSEETGLGCRNIRAGSDCGRCGRVEAERDCRCRCRGRDGLEEALEDIACTLEGIEECTCQRIPRLLMRILDAVEDNKRPRC